MCQLGYVIKKHLAFIINFVANYYPIPKIYFLGLTLAKVILLTINSTTTAAATSTITTTTTTTITTTTAATIALTITNITTIPLYSDRLWRYFTKPMVDIRL